MANFEGFPSLARLNRDCTITEKIDGSNGGIHIEELDSEKDYTEDEYLLAEVKDESKEFDTYYGVYAQSRKRLITPKSDNFGFATWVQRNATGLVETLGEGLHFGEWWGNGIQRGYGLPNGEKRFSLFNTLRWRETDLSGVEGLGMVPELFIGHFTTETIEWYKNGLKKYGSVAVSGFLNPEGLVVFHHASRSAYKTTFDDCDDYGYGGGKTWKA